MALDDQDLGHYWGARRGSGEHPGRCSGDAVVEGTIIELWERKDYPIDGNLEGVDRSLTIRVAWKGDT